MSQSEDIYHKLSEDALVYDYLHHFTSIDCFKLIIEGQRLLLNRIDNVKDENENKFLPYLWNTKVFVGCFTHSNKGKKKFWDEYAHNNGVRISFQNSLLNEENLQITSANNHVFEKRVKTNLNHREYNKDCDWGYFDISKVDILYINPSDSLNWINCGNGLVKNYGTNDSYD